MAAPKQSLYEILGVAPDANELDIGLAHQRRMLELQRAVPQDPSQIAYVTQAFEVLSNPKRRAAYDASLVTQQEKAAAAAQAAAPDLVLEPEEDEEIARRRKVLLPVVIGIAVVVSVIIGFRVTQRAEPPKPAAEPVAEAPKPPPPQQPMSQQQIMLNASQAVGRVLSYDMSGRAEPLGLAVAVEPGAFVTTCHGIPAGSQLVMRTGQESRSATLTVTDEQLDLCKLSVPGFDAKPLAVSDADPKAGDRIYALGANAKGDFALTEGKVKSIRSTPAGKVIELSFPVSKTGSGGAVFDTFGRVVGIATTPHAYGPGIEVALPASWISQMRSRGK